MSLSPVESRKNVVQRLPEDLQSFLRSGVTITSPCQCVEELVLNAIDAKATCIAVRLDLQYFKIQVIDNGIGICLEDLELLGERYTTSKCRKLEDLNNLEFYGFRGEALASMKQVAGVLEIVTRSSSSDKTYCKLFLHGKTTQLSPSVFPRPSQGTTVTAYDFMYNLPVRKKSINNILDVEQIRTRLEAIVLVHPEISLTLRNDSDHTKYLQTIKCSSILSVFSQLFGAKKATSLQSVRNNLGPFTTEGFISVNTSRNKQLQFLYINKRLVLKTKIHKLINDVFSKCLITKPKSNVPSTFNESPKSAESGNCAIFVLNITCLPSEYDICLDPSKTLVEFKDWNTVLRCVYLTVIDFLKTENLMKPNFTELNFAFSEFSDIISKEINGSKSGMVDFKEKEADNLKKALCSLLAKRNVSHSCNDSNAVTFLQQCTEDLGKLSENILKDKLTNEEMKSSNTNVIKSGLCQQNNNEKRKSTSATETDSNTKKVKIVLKPNEAISTVSSLQEFKNQLLKEGKIVKQSKFSADGFLAEKCQNYYQVFDKNKGICDESSSSSMIKKPLKNDLNKHRQKMPISLQSRSQIKKPSILKKIIKRKNCLTAVSNLQKFTFKVNPPLKGSKSQMPHNEINESPIDSTNYKAQNCLPLIKLYNDSHTIENKIKLKEKSCVSNCYKSHERSNCKCSLCKENKLGEKITCPKKNHEFLTTTSLIETAQDKLPINWEKSESNYRNNESEMTVISNKRYNSEEPALDSNLFVLSNQIENTSSKNISSPHENSVIEHNLSLPFQSNNNSEEDDKLSIKDSDLKESPNDPPPNFVYTPSLHLHEYVSPSDHLNETQTFVPLSGNEHYSISDAETLPFNSSYNCSDVDLNGIIKLQSEDPQTNLHLSNQESLQSSLTKTDETLLNRRRESVSLQKYSEEFERFCIKLSENIKSTEHVVGKINKECGGGKPIITLQSESFKTEHSSSDDSDSLSNKKAYEIYSNSVSNLTEKENDSNLITDLMTLESHNEMINPFKDDASRKEEFDMLELNDPGCHETNFLLSDSYPSAGQPPKQDVTEILDQKDQQNENSFGAFLSNSYPCDEISYIINNNDTKINSRSYSNEEERLEIDQGKRLDINDKIDTVDDDDSTKKYVIEAEDHINDKDIVSANAEFRVYSENRNWICHEDEITGQLIYIHRKMGNSSFLPPPSDNSNHENIAFSESALLLGNVSKPFSNQEENPVARKTLPPSSFSHLVNLLYDVQDDETTSDIKWKGQKDKIEFASNEMVDKFLNWQNPILRIPSEEVIENAYVQETWSSSIKAYNIIHPYKFRKDIFNNYKVLNQVDNKFIACVVNVNQSDSSLEQGLIVLFDQHAVHERIRLEQLIADIHQNENLDDFQLNAVQLTSPTDIILNPGEVRIALSFIEVFKKFGIELHPHSSNRNKLIIHSVPKCVVKNELAKNQNQQPIDLTLIEKLLHDIITMVEQTKGANYVLPKTLIQILNSQACHGAVKFGDKLSFKACCVLLNQLKICQLPFQCAHGRPSVVPLVDLDLFKKIHKKHQQSKPKLWKLRRYFQNLDEDSKLLHS